ncbi:hypothetical protein [Pyxidicoccus caerfyrddinensis]|uniref:hypothetical protein n=1 Tax=Pyxidicoccus caerfyrddinensis TaxID=2709663 RepID=UPI003B83970B
MVRFQDFYLRRDGPWPRGLGPLRSGLGFAPLGFWQVMRRDRFFMNRAYYRTFRGRAPDVVRARASEWFEHEKRRRPDLWTYRRNWRPLSPRRPVAALCAPLGRWRAVALEGVRGPPAACLRAHCLRVGRPVWPSRWR